MSPLILYAADLVAISLLCFGVYYPRHHRRDLVVSYLAVNVAVMAVAAMLLDNMVGAGIGLGLFGVLSIIRLRSEELSQRDVAYYFSSLALGLLGGLAGSATLTVTLMAAIVGILFIADHPKLLPAGQRRLIVLDRTWEDDEALRSHLAQRLEAEIVRINVMKVDLVNDSTTVEVWFHSHPARLRLPVAEAVQ